MSYNCGEGTKLQRDINLCKTYINTNNPVTRWVCGKIIADRVVSGREVDSLREAMVSIPEIEEFRARV
jgi:hypothetical protein